MVTKATSTHFQGGRSKVSAVRVLPGGRIEAWVWTDRPNARDLKDFGGRCEVRPAVGTLYYNVPIGFAVREGTDQGFEPWRVEVLHIVGSRGADESWETIDSFNCFTDALKDAKRRCLAAIAYASDEEHKSASTPEGGDKP
jgi:hypothetical protein